MKICTIAVAMMLVTMMGVSLSESVPENKISKKTSNTVIDKINEFIFRAIPLLSGGEYNILKSIMDMLLKQFGLMKFGGRALSPQAKDAAMTKTGRAMAETMMSLVDTMRPVMKEREMVERGKNGTEGKLLLKEVKRGKNVRKEKLFLKEAEKLEVGKNRTDGKDLLKEEMERGNNEREGKHLLKEREKVEGSKYFLKKREESEVEKNRIEETLKVERNVTRMEDGTTVASELSDKTTIVSHEG